QQRLVADRVHLLDHFGAGPRAARRACQRAVEDAAQERQLFEEARDHLSNIVKRLSEIMIATAAATTASLTARPTPTAPPLTVTPKWQLVIEIARPKTAALMSPIHRSIGCRLSANECRNDESSTPSSSLPNSAPPRIATASPNSVRQKSETII